MSKEQILGIDVGASGIKGAIIDLESGQLVTERFRVTTPQPSTTKAVAEALNSVVKHFKWSGLIGVGFPSVIKDGVSYTAANIHESWIEANVKEIMSRKTGCEVYVCNDADAAGLAEMAYGAGRKQKGTVLLITVGTGLGSALFINGKMFPNTEFGHLYLKGQEQIAEQFAADSVRKREGLSWSGWAQRFNLFLNLVNYTLYPDLIILGGGASKKFEKFSEQLKSPAKVIPAQLLNNAGIIGAALYAHQVQLKEAY
ncbi:MAG: ROK family protein [Bacteroidota bacterium]